MFDENKWGVRILIACDAIGGLNNRLRCLVSAMRVDDDIKLITKKNDAKGKFGRILGDFFVKGVTVSSVMIERHHAVAYHGQSKEDIREAHLANRKRVRI